MNTNVRNNTRNITTRSFALACHLVASGIEPLEVQSVDGTPTNAVYTFPQEARAVMEHFYRSRNALNDRLDAAINHNHGENHDRTSDRS